MPRIEALQANFSSGELSPLMVAREDFARFQSGAAVQENFLTLLEGGVTKRPGTRYVAACKVGTTVRLQPFDFRDVDALILEIGAAYVRFYASGARVESGGTPVEVTTPYADTHIAALRLTQKNDVIYLTQQSYAPRKLQRLSNTNWQLVTMIPSPPPTAEAGRHAAVTLTLGAVSGSGVAVTASSAVFLSSDVDREITYGAGLAVITAVASATSATVDILSTFASTTLPSTEWVLEGSPVALLDVDKSGPVGGQITLRLLKEQPSAANLVTNGDFASGLTDWTDYSGGTVATGTHDGGLNEQYLADSTADFLGSGVQTTMTLTNTTDGRSGSIETVSATSLLATLAGGVNNDWDTGDAYEVTRTGSAHANDGNATLSGGTAGIAWIEQEITTVAAQTYRLTFHAGGNGISCQVGSIASGSDLYAETFFSVNESGEEKVVVFTATGTSAFLQFRNNQQANGTVDDVACRPYGSEGWRSDDVGKYIYANDGLIKLTTVSSAQVALGQIMRELLSDADVAAGAWTLETEAWNTTDGYPAISVFHEERLHFLSSPTYPQTDWGSVSGDFENFTRGTGAADSFSYTLAEARGLVHWAVPAEQLMLGAENGQFRMVGQGDGPIVASSPPLVRRVGSQGTAAVEPVVSDISVVFVQRQGATLREMTFQQASLTSSIPDLSRLSGHLLEEDSIVQLAYAQQPWPVIWAVRSDGTLLSITYDRDEQVIAWARHTMGGGGLVRSVAIIPHPTRNAHQVWLVVERNGAKAVEVLDDTIIGVDAAVHYQGLATTTITGLSHLNGQTVRMAGIPATGTHWADLGGATVASGSVTLPVSCTQAYVGLPYTATLQTLPATAQNAPFAIRRKQKRWQEGYATFHQTGPGVQLNGKAFPLPQQSGTYDDGPALFTGSAPLPSLGWARDVRWTLTHDTPLPCTVLAIGGALEVGDT